MSRHVFRDLRYLADWGFWNPLGTVSVIHGGQLVVELAMKGDWRSDLDGWFTLFIEACGTRARARTCPAYIAGPSS